MPREKWKSVSLPESLLKLVKQYVVESEKRYASTAEFVRRAIEWYLAEVCKRDENCNEIEIFEGDLRIVRALARQLNHHEKIEDTVADIVKNLKIKNHKVYVNGAEIKVG